MNDKMISKKQRLENELETMDFLIAEIKKIAGASINFLTFDTIKSLHLWAGEVVREYRLTKKALEDVIVDCENEMQRLGEVDEG